MDAERLKTYARMVDKLEEPIREIVPAIWRLPYVIDTGYTCCGHVYESTGFTDLDYEGLDIKRSPDHWYPHRAMLEIAYSVDPGLTGARSFSC